METVLIRFISQPFDLCEGGELGVNWHPKFPAFKLLAECNARVSEGFCGFVTWVFLTEDTVVRIFSRSYVK